MLWITRLVKILLILLALCLGIWFTLDNTQEVTLILFGLTLPSAKLGFWILAGFVLGIAIGFFGSLWPYANVKQKLLRQDRQLKRSEKELTKLRAGALKE